MRETPNWQAAFDRVELLNSMHALYPSNPDTIDAVLQALTKQIPMRVTDIHVDEYYCPACGAENNADQSIVPDRYCPRCGQRIYQEEDINEY